MQTPPLQLDRTLAALACLEVTRSDVGLVLGSGQGPVADALGLSPVAEMADLDGWPVGKVTGHVGRVYAGERYGLRVLVAAGRRHLYEGCPLEDVVFFPQLLAALGGRTLLLCNAAGSLRRDLPPGRLVLIEDHVDTTWQAWGAPEDTGLARGPVCAGYDAGLRQAARQAAARVGIVLAQGVYAFCRGPQYETPAEIRLLSAWGCAVVGMSLVPEALTARGCGLAVGALSTVTNYGTGLGDGSHSHADVVAAAQRATHDVAAVLDAWLRELAEGAAGNAVFRQERATRG